VGDPAWRRPHRPQIGYDALPPLARDVYDRLASLGLAWASAPSSGRCWTSTANPELAPSSDLLRRLLGVASGRSGVTVGDRTDIASRPSIVCFAVDFPRFTDPRERRGMSALRLGRANGKVWVAMLIAVLAAGCTSAGHDHSKGGRVARPASAGQPGSARQALADEAARVVREYWRARNLAYSALKIGPLLGYEDQAAAALSRAEVDYQRANGLPPDP
jgi:hypothetical protein